MSDKTEHVDEHAPVTNFDEPIRMVGMQEAVHPVYGPITNTVMFYAQASREQPPLLVLSPTGFWVREVKVEQDEHEAQRVYQAFAEWVFRGDAGDRFETRAVNFEDQCEVYGPIARILGQREHKALEAFREAYRSFELPVSGTTLVLREHLKVLRAFTDVLSEETGASFDWEVVPPHGFYLRLGRSVQTRQGLHPWVLSVSVFEITTEEAGGSVCVNHADVWDPCGPAPVRSRFLDTQALQKQLAAALSLPVLRRNIRVLVDMGKVHDRG